ncbi:MAG: hypothetical protein ACHQAY_23010 [Hyphomicrobiales bacterium]
MQAQTVDRNEMAARLVLDRRMGGNAMAQPNEQSGPSTAQWLISPQLPAGARLQLSSILDAERLSPEVLELLAKFTKDLQQLEKDKPPTDPCPKLEQCQDYHKPCTVLTYCGTFSVKAFAL